MVLCGCTCEHLVVGVGEPAEVVRQLIRLRGQFNDLASLSLILNPISRSWTIFTFCSTKGPGSD